MRRFFLPDVDEKTERAEVTGDEFKHLKRVLRLRAGDRIAVFNGRGVELSGHLETVGLKQAVVAFDRVTRLAGESPLRITLLQGLVKSEKPELIIQKSVELGLDAVVFFTAERSVAGRGGRGKKASDGPTAKKLERLERVAIEAAKQCGRSELPEIFIARDINGAIALAPPEDSIRLIFLETDEAMPLTTLLAAGAKSGGVTVLVGPEGGFTPGEAATALEAGFAPAGLGPRILRAETAAIAAVSIVQYQLGDLGQRTVRPRL